jgi:hypothetical protein
MSAGPEDTAGARTCPECAHPLSVHPGFVTWCDECDWNVDPSQAKRPTRRWTRRRQARDDRAARQVYERVRARGPDAEKARRVLANVAAAPVHLLTVGLVVLAVLTAVSSMLAAFKVIFVAVLLGVVWLVAPRPGRMGRGGRILTRVNAPQTYALADEVASIISARPPDAIVVTGAFNAGYGIVGLRRTRVLEIGRPLWNILTPPERVALLGHEMGHDVSRDRRRSSSRASAMGATGSAQPPDDRQLASADPFPPRLGARAAGQRTGSDRAGRADDGCGRGDRRAVTTRRVVMTLVLSDLSAMMGPWWGRRPGMNR